MTEPERKSTEDIVRELIEAQERAALARFRASPFQERLEKGIQATVSRTSRPSLLHVLPSPVWVSLAFMALLGGALLLPRLFRTSAPESRLSIEHFLRQFAAIQAIENHAQTPPAAWSLRPSPLVRMIAGTLANPASSTKTSSVLGPTQPFSAGVRKAERLNLQELYEILLINKSVERILTGIFQKTKEG